MKHWPIPYFVAPVDGEKLLVCNPEMVIAELHLSPEIHPADEAARQYDLGTAEYLAVAANQKPSSDVLAARFLEFMSILEDREESDSGHEVHHTKITSCRCMVPARLAIILPEMKRLAQSLLGEDHSSKTVEALLETGHKPAARVSSDLDNGLLADTDSIRSPMDR